MGNSCRIFIAIILIISLFTVSVFATPTGSYDLYSTNGRNVNSYSASGNAYISNFSQHLAYIRVYLDQILSYNANISTTIDYYLPALLQRMVDAFSPAAGDTRSMWQLSSAMVSGITAIQSAALGIAQDVYNINTTTADIDRLTGLIHSDVDQVESQLSSINTNIQSLESIDWITDTNATIQYSTDGINYYDYSSQVVSDEIYFKITSSSISNCLYYFVLPISAYSFNNRYNYIYLDLYVRDNPISSEYYYYNNYYYNMALFVDPLVLNTTNADSLIVKVYSDYNLHTVNFSYFSAKYLPITSKDFYILDQYIYNKKLTNLDNLSNLSDIKNILIDIDNNSDFIQNNNDLQINVDIDPSVGTGVTGVISKIQDLLDFGISLQEFIVVLNQFDNLQWFTRPETYEQVNQDPRFSPGYIDLYD